MNDHGSMNRIYRLVWSHVRRAWIPVAETARGRAKAGHTRTARRDRAAVATTALSLALVPPPLAQAGPAGGQIVAGKGSITQSGAVTDIHQSSQTLSIDWLSFNVAPKETVDFIQPSSGAIAVNRIGSSSGSEILGHLESNGQVFLINPNGVLFGAGSQVNVGGLVASTLDLSDSSLASSSRSFTGSGAGSVINAGTITAARGGYVSLIGTHVSNQGVISAQLGTVALGAGSAVTLTFNDSSLVHLTVDRSVLNSLAENHGLIQADGGKILMTAGAKNALLASVVNNTGLMEARTVENHAGTITLLGGKTAGTVNVGGTLDASAPEGNGGFIETSAAHVEVADSAKITTSASQGLTGSWLVEPHDLTVAATGGDITGTKLSSELGTNNITLQSSSGVTAGAGNININDKVSWKAHQLTLTAADNVNVNAVMTATGSASLAMNPATANGGDAAVAGGTVLMGLGASGFTGTVNFNSTGTLSIGGHQYTVINSLGTPGSTTGTDLQGINGNLGGDYVLGSNINASATSTWNSGAGFAPIGGAFIPFFGIFDGLGHTISSVVINGPSAAVVGVFGESYSGATVRNVGVIGGSVTGQYVVGALVGYSYGSMIVNSYASTRVTGAGTLSAMNGVGGLVGISSGSISNSYATGNVSGVGQGADTGGLVGLSLGPISSSYATGVVYGYELVGGLVGSFGCNKVGCGPISNSYATGNVNGTVAVGGLAGGNGAQVNNSYATGNVTGSNYVGGLIGLGGSDSSSSSLGNGAISNSYSTGNVTGSNSVGGLIGSLSGYGSISKSYATGNVTGSDDVGGLLGKNDGGIGTIANSHATGRVSGTADIGGLVGYCDGSEGSIYNSYATGIVNGTKNIGGLIGYDFGGAAITNSYATGSVSGSDQIGGLIGLDQDGAIANAYATGSVNGSTYVGGLIGVIEGGSVNKSYSTGYVNGMTSVGGLIGQNSSTVTNSFWDVNTSGQTTSAGGIGMTTSQMQTKANFTSATAANGNVNPGWDFKQTWMIKNGQTYPLLRSIAAPTTLSVERSAGVTAAHAAVSPSGSYSNRNEHLIDYGSRTSKLDPLASEWGFGDANIIIPVADDLSVE